MSNEVVLPCAQPCGCGGDCCQHIAYLVTVPPSLFPNSVCCSRYCPAAPVNFYFGSALIPNGGGFGISIIVRRIDTNSGGGEFDVRWVAQFLGQSGGPNASVFFEWPTVWDDPVTAPICPPSGLYSNPTHGLATVQFQDLPCLSGPPPDLPYMCCLPNGRCVNLTQAECAD